MTSEPEDSRDGQNRCLIAALGALWGRFGYLRGTVGLC